MKKKQYKKVYKLFKKRFKKGINFSTKSNLVKEGKNSVSDLFQKNITKEEQKQKKPDITYKISANIMQNNYYMSGFFFNDVFVLGEKKENYLEGQKRIPLLKNHKNDVDSEIGYLDNFRFEETNFLTADVNFIKEYDNKIYEKVMHKTNTLKEKINFSIGSRYKEVDLAMSENFDTTYISKRGYMKMFLTWFKNMSLKEASNMDGSKLDEMIEKSQELYKEQIKKITNQKDFNNPDDFFVVRKINIFETSYVMFPAIKTAQSKDLHIWDHDKEYKKEEINKKFLNELALLLKE